ncbi:MAG: hypothetical protein J0L50_04675 [Sphingomonadales bacterium]|nr:hypothetical protein [Sphingomonadales bacterium]
MKGKLSVTLGASIFAATPAVACMESPLPQAVVFGSKPAVQPGTFVINLTAMSRVPNSYDARVLVMDGPSDLIGQTVNFTPENLGSCTAFGRQSGYAVVRRSIVEGKAMLIGLAYERSWIDTLFAFFGMEPYYVPAQYQPPVHFQ